MAQATISRFRQLIRSLQYVVERQRDAQTREVKDVVAGVTLDGAPAEIVVKVGFGGKLVIITVYLC